MSKKRILITAGSTWVKVDDVRILANRFTGKTGLYLAEKLKEKGHSVVLLANPHCLCKVKGVRIVSFRYFDEFKKQVVKILKENNFDAIIHTAAVSDYKLKNIYRGKISSRKNKLQLALVPTEKVVKRMRALAKKSLLIQFKLEAKRRGLKTAAFLSLNENKSNFVVANALEDLKSGYKGFLINRGNKALFLDSKRALLKALEQIIASF